MGKDALSRGSCAGGRGGAIAAGASIVAIAVSAAWVGGAAAVELDWGDVTGSIITSLSVGTQVRMADRDPRNVGFSNGGAMPTAGNDDGNLNFDRGDLITLVGTVSSELSLRWKNYRAYVRGTAFYDYIADNNDLAVNGPEERGVRGAYTGHGHKYARYDVDLMDAYVAGDFDVLDRALSIRLGNQVLNWGEALFTINAISVINPIDVAKIRTPGAELRDALIPIPMLSASYQLFDGLSMEAFVAFDFEPYKLEACGSFFSSTDTFCTGTRGVGVGTDFADTRSYYKGRNDPNDDFATYDGITADARVDDDASGTDWGVALRYFSPELNNTEFGLYYVHYQSRLPSIRANSDYLNPNTGTINGLPYPSRAFGTRPRSTVLDNLDHGQLTIYYPDDVEMLGLSFNTTVDALGIAVNGEISYKWNVPVWISEPTLTFTVYNYAGGNPLLAGEAFGFAPYVETGYPYEELADGPVDLRLDEPHDMWNANIRVTKILPTTHWLVSAIGANAMTVLAEAAALYFDIDPDGPYDYASYGQNGFSGFSTRPLEVVPGVEVVPALYLPDQGDPRVPATWKPPTQWSGGVTGLAFADYPNAFDMGINLTPFLAVSTGLFGTTPAPNPGFTKSVNSLYVGFKADYLSKYGFQVTYFKSWGGGGGGGGSRNPYIDRDFIGFTASYVF
ncbi:DUF1302 domain-containing protein [Zavarzinia compransoris]|uniref:DUF1302 domain-containing protein n=1 Tax=Zavarzinia marina TaxID=2911065 RepID=UPI001F3C3796|nr:DUF1302 family protein [Zavarzinia marina]MCF4165704.1 DUF1302 domain-containing protein [Zavarzinia marina]